MSPWALFSGPHKKKSSIDECENILIVASSFGIAVHLPYLKELIHEFKCL